jgi:hypothetical protein
MDQQSEEEFLLHIAAGTDPLTALAAMPREDKSQGGPASVLDLWFSAIVWIIVAGIGIAVSLLILLR